MKITFVTSRYPPFEGGVETHVSAIATRLADRSHDVTVHTADRVLFDDVDPPVTESIDGVEVRRHRSFAPAGTMHIAPGIVPGIRTGTTDIVHAHNYHSFPLLLAALAGTPTGAFVVTPHYHAGSPDPLRDKLLNLYRPLGGWAVRHADARIAVSGWERRALARDFDVDATVIPNGVQVQRFADAVPETRSSPFLLCVGRLERYKGYEHAIRALSELPGYELVLVGTGPDRDRLVDVAVEANVRDRTTFLGFVSDNRLPGLYAGAAAHLQLSTHESFGVTVAESLAAGSPCVVRKTGALAEWGERDDCIAISEVGPSTVADAVGRAVELTAPATPIASWDTVTDEIEELYRSLRPDP